eukprot:894113-Pelagomonas_calceolata.AAC.6
MVPDPGSGSLLLPMAFLRLISSGYTTISAGLKRSKTLRKLSFAGSRMGDAKVSAERKSLPKNERRSRAGRKSACCMQRWTELFCVFFCTLLWQPLCPYAASCWFLKTQ